MPILNNIIFTPLKLQNLTLKNRILRSNTYGNFDNLDGSGSQARLNWEEKFAKGGVGAIISGVAPIHSEARIVPNAATIDSDQSIPFWTKVATTVHQYDCKYIIQFVYGANHLRFLSQTLTYPEIQAITQVFANATRRAREAGLDGVEIDATPSGTGQLFTDLSEANLQPPNLVAQFLSPEANHRQDDYNGSLAARSRFLLEIIATIRREVGPDFHIQVKYGETKSLADDIQICQWLAEAGVDAIHTGRKIPYVDQYTSGDFPLDIEGEHIDRVRQIKQAVNIPIFCNGGFQTASYISKVLSEGYCDSVTLARALIANNDLVKIFAQGQDSPDKPCTYCEKCRINLTENPLGCYDVSRYDGDYQKMAQNIMSIYQ